MYSARFTNSKGQSFFFGYQYGNIFDIDGLTGHEIDVALSQGFNQIGETIENLSIKSRELEIKGRILGEATQAKNKMLSVFAPFESGQLVFEEKYYIDCVVRFTPLITPEKRDPRFELVVTAPYPFWQKINAESYIVGGFKPMFSFPVNYTEPHIFGVPTTEAFINCINNGEVEAYFKLEFRGKGEVVNPGIINIRTQEFLKLNTTLYLDEKITIYRENGKLLVEKESGGVTEDAFSVLDEESELLFMHVGDNILRATADENDSLLVTTITFKEAVVGVYEGI